MYKKWLLGKCLWNMHLETQIVLSPTIFLFLSTEVSFLARKHIHGIVKKTYHSLWVYQEFSLIMVFLDSIWLTAFLVPIIAIYVLCCKPNMQIFCIQRVIFLNLIMITLITFCEFQVLFWTILYHCAWDEMSQKEYMYLYYISFDIILNETRIWTVCHNLLKAIWLA